MDMGGLQVVIIITNAWIWMAFRLLLLLLMHGYGWPSGCYLSHPLGKGKNEMGGNVTQLVIVGLRSLTVRTSFYKVFMKYIMGLCF